MRKSMRKKIADIGLYAAFSVALMIALADSANAYVDPSVLTYVIQAVAGIVITIGAAAGIYWRKTRKKINDKLGIDENAKKEVEEDVVIK